MKIIKSYIILIFVVLLTSCFYQPEKEKLYGTYIRVDNGPDTIELKPSGIYIYKGFYDHEKIINQGSWELSTNKSEIKFNDFTFGNSKGNWYSKVKKREGGPALIYASDSNIYFKKID